MSARKKQRKRRPVRKARVFRGQGGIVHRIEFVADPVDYVYALGDGQIL